MISDHDPGVASGEIFDWHHSLFTIRLLKATENSNMW